MFNVSKYSTKPMLVKQSGSPLLADHHHIIDGKIWIQQDGTEIGSANELVELGVPKHDIVLGFDPPNLRHYTDFAVN